MIYYCEQCQQQKDNDYDLAEIVDGETVCEKCYEHPYHRKKEDLDISVGGDEWMRQARELDNRMKKVLQKVKPSWTK